MASEGADVLHKVEQKALAADILEGSTKGNAHRWKKRSSETG